MSDRLDEIKALPQSRKFSPKNVEWLIGEVERLRKSEQDWRDSCQHAASDRDRLRAALDAVDHATYGWSFGMASTMVDKIRLIARNALAAAAALQEPQ